ncbi:hypothetical protein K458DRAFT_295182 [Lentithecium fluviatile CBS 122367]|uniref:Vacuolar protein sorting-associated protein TDA6 n=1 Tax=Lentithecium fluviatile CBS 122367 TaxID=1168545 RepID=A0A6G1JD27_9PLEO|nr:hypothetical protein K458DRAFT_295182 [Lentithecium fluviatile CBS 122367]
MKGGKPAAAAAGTFLSLLTFSQIYQQLVFPRVTPPSERAEEASWVASSHSWLDRKVCNWFGFCGLSHLNKAHWTTKNKFGRLGVSAAHDGDSDKIDLKEFWNGVHQLPEDWSEKELGEREIPKYVIDHAPLIHLYSGENFWPGDIADHLIHTTPHLNYTPLQATDDHPTLANLDGLNKWGRFVYLQSDDNVEDRPQWLGGRSNIPDVPEDSNPDDPDEDNDRTHGHFEEDTEGENSDWFNSGIGDTKEKGGIRPTGSAAPGPVPTRTPEGEELVDDEIWQSELIRPRLRIRGKRVVGGRSDAPAVLIVVPKDNGVVDAFWFFFYSYNLGNSVFNVRFGNHVGDWEHTAVRFQDGVPKAVYFSEHSFGDAYTWDAVEKKGDRPVGFSATGTHAMYATEGVHPYVLPGGILHDVTDRGPLWDPTLNMYSFTYDYQRDNLRSSNLTPQAPTEWFFFQGHWGDKFYPLSDPRQYRFLGQYHYVNGPLGPRFKNLGRQEICGGGDDCLLKRWIGDKRARPYVKRFPDVGEGEEMSEEDVRRFVGPNEYGA